MFNGEVVAFAGDWHGDSLWACEMIERLAGQGITTIFHVGDFGIWHGPLGKRYLMAVERACDRSGVTLLVTPGNHEDWSRLDSKKSKDGNDGWGAIKHITDHVKVLPRAHRFTVTTPSGTTRTFVSLGGAPSINFTTLSEGWDWWPSEMITEEDVDATVTEGYADVMIAHDSPDTPYCVDQVAHILRNNPMGWDQRGLDYARIGRERMTRAYEGVQPWFFFHGHYHARGVTENSHGRGEHENWVVALDMQRQTGNIARLNLDTMELI